MVNYIRNRTQLSKSESRSYSDQTPLQLSVSHNIVLKPIASPVFVCIAGVRDCLFQDFLVGSELGTIKMYQTSHRFLFPLFSDSFCLSRPESNFVFALPPPSRAYLTVSEVRDRLRLLAVASGTPLLVSIGTVNGVGFP